MKNNNGEDVTLDSVLGTGVGSDRAVQSPDNLDDGGNATPPVTTDVPPSEAPPATPVTGEENLQSYIAGLNSNELSEEDSAVRNDILSKFKGTSFDASGNILDGNGEVVVPFEKIADYVNNGDVILDEEGNQVDEEGKIIKSKEEIAIEDSVVNGIHKGLEVEFLDDSGNPKIYSDDDAGFKDLSEDLGKHYFEEYKANLFNSNPELAEIAKHILSGGRVEDFQSTIDFTKVDSKKLSDSEKVDYIKKSFIAQGVDSDRADRLANLVKDANELDKEMPKALKTLDDIEQQKVAERDRIYQQSIEKQNENLMQYWGNVNSIVQQGRVKDVQIPEGDRAKFFEYLSKPINNSSKSQEMIDNEQEDIETKLMFSYLRYKKFDLNTLINQRARQVSVDSLRARINKHKNSNTPINAGQRGQGAYEGDITIDMLH